ncbi:RNA helicase [Plasmodium gonderi]|uniref:RNA helicase n=1 Tax=Plasmodium gonderi TaxID=77519 RepID=A0A1Y1JC06_PLAGO|nr:RNA helicase [Plasmodium gonderi]GAW78895.1 RNA helicase [Plasmodium gonderi]
MIKNSSYIHSLVKREKIVNSCTFLCSICRSRSILSSRKWNSTMTMGGELKMESEGRYSRNYKIRTSHIEDVKIDETSWNKTGKDKIGNDEKTNRRNVSRRNLRGAHLKEELQNTSFLEFNFKTDIYLRLSEMKIFTPTEIQRNVIPLLLQGRGGCEEQRNEMFACDENKDIYNEILKSRIQVNEYLRTNFRERDDFYDIGKYKTTGDGKEDSRCENVNGCAGGVKPSGQSKELGEGKEKCFNDVYLIVSPDNTGKTLSYFLPILNNFYLNNEKIMKNLSNFYHFLNKYNYKKFRNKLFRKKEKLKCLKNKNENLFFHIAYEKYKIRNRYIYMRKYKNYNLSSSYIKNKRNNQLNCLKHKKNVFFPYAIILTNTREAAFELYSFLKSFDINIELLTGGYLYKKKSLKKFHIETLSPLDSRRRDEGEYDTENMFGNANMKSEFLKTNDFLKKISKNVKTGTRVINYNIDIIIGTPDKIFEKVDNCKNKHLYNFKFLKYVVVEQSETLCNVFNEKKLQLLFNHIKNYTNMYYFRGTKAGNVLPIEYTHDESTGHNDIHYDPPECKKKDADLENEGVRTNSRKGRSRRNLRDMEKKNVEKEEVDDKECLDEYKICHMEKGTFEKSERKCGPSNFSDGNSMSISACDEIRTDENTTECGKTPEHREGTDVFSYEASITTESSRYKEERTCSSKKKGEENVANIIHYTNNGNCGNSGNGEYSKNEKNTLNSNIPISIFVSATKTFCISEFLSNNVRSKYIQQIINMKSHDISSEMKHVFINSKNKEKVALLLELLNSKRVKKCTGGVYHSNFFNRYVIFCNTRKSVQNLKDVLSELKYKVSCIHNEMNYKERSQNYRNFKKNRTNILICTNILSRGVQFENCEIINYDISNNINDYIYKSSKVSCNSHNGNYSSKNNSLTSFFNKKNVPLVNDIIEKTVDKKKIIFQNLNKKVSKMLKLQNKYYDIVKKKKKYQKRGGRKALHIAPRRNCLSKKNKILSKKLYFYNKMNLERKRLIKKGILKGHEKIPRFPNRKVEVYDSNEYNAIHRLDDGALQILAKKRKTKKNKNGDRTTYEEDTIVLENMPTYEDETKAKEKSHQKKTYF